MRGRSKIVGTGVGTPAVSGSDGRGHAPCGGGGFGVAFHSGAPPSALRDCRDALSRRQRGLLSSIMARGGGHPVVEFVWQSHRHRSQRTR